MVGYLTSPGEEAFMLCQKDLSKPFWQSYVDDEDLHPADCFPIEVAARITDPISNWEAEDDD